MSKQKPLKISPAQHAHLVMRIQVAGSRRADKLKDIRLWCSDRLPKAARPLRRRAKQLEAQKSKLDKRVEQMVEAANDRLLGQRQKIQDEATSIRELLLFGDPGEGLAAVKKFEGAK